MKKLFTLLLLFVTALPVLAFQLERPEIITLPNGMKVYYLKDSTLPLVAVRMVIGQAGTMAEPAEGMADLMADLMLKGTASRSAETISEELDFLGATLSIGAEQEFLVVDGNCLANHLPRWMDLAADAFLHPAFPEEELTKEKARRADSLKNIKDDPARSVRQYFQKLYFKGHPLASLSIGNEASLTAISREPLLRFYQSNVRPDRAIMAVVGDVSRQDLQQLLDKHWSAWTAKAAVADAGRPPVSIPVPRGKICLLVDKPDATQAYFVYGVPGISKSAPETPAAQVMNTLFGGRFTSWLNTELRIKRGLTYGVRSSFQAWHQGGIFTVSSYTRNEKIGEMLALTMDLIKKGRTEGFSSTETESARNYILGQFPPTLETLAARARAYTELEFYGLGLDFYGKLLQGVAGMNPEGLNKLANRILSPDDYVLVVVGKASEISEQLKPFGEFTVKSISLPGFE